MIFKKYQIENLIYYYPSDTIDKIPLETDEDIEVYILHKISCYRKINYITNNKQKKINIFDKIKNHLTKSQKKIN